jgi:CheY-like chemotaxis protein
MTSVIIVDDQSSNRRILSELVGTLGPGVRVSSFADPLQALSYAREYTPDLLITDFKMPSIDGAELIRRFRSLLACKAVPVMVVTAYDDLEFRLLAFKAGATDFILSPLDYDAFRAQSRKLLLMDRSDQFAPSVFDIAAGQSVAAEPDGQFEMHNGLIENLSAQLLDRLKELARLSTEMQRLLDISNTAAIFVDEGLLIRRFTPSASGMYALSKQDIGRSLADITCELEYHDLANDFRQVMLTGESLKRWLRHRDGESCYRLRIIPTRRGRDRPTGATLIFFTPFTWQGPDNKDFLH